jgi:hypothetical protein
MRGRGLLAGVIGTCLMVGIGGTATAAGPVPGSAARGATPVIDTILPLVTVVVTVPPIAVPLCLACLLPI